jgi:acid phosphatase type 7
MHVAGLLAVVVCVLAAGVAPLPAATFVQAPYLQNMGTDHVTILWSARENQSATVQYSTDASFSRTAQASIRNTFSQRQTGMGFEFYQYRADLTGLSAGTTYNYRVMMGGQPADTNTPQSKYLFKTAGAGPFTFLVYGDSGDSSSHQIAVALQMAKEQPNFVIHVGDIAYESGTYTEFTNNYFADYPSLMRSTCFFPIAGNHEYYTDNSAPYLALTAPPSNGVPQDEGRYYSFDWGNVHFIGLDANLLDTPFPDAQARMLDWLENDLSNSQAIWKIAFWHQTPYPISHHIDDPVDLAARNLLVPTLERHGVQLVLTGHEHNYQRSKPMRGGVPVPPGTPGTFYVTSGGGGSAVLHPVSPQTFLDQQASIWEYLRVTVDNYKLTLQTIEVDDPALSNFIRDNPNGKEFDRLVITIPPLLQNDSVVNGADFLPSLASGGLVSIFGQNLASGNSQATSFPLPLTLGGGTVTLNGTPMSLTFASASQINAALPLDAIGTEKLRVTTNGGFSEIGITISDSAPAIFASAITHLNGTLVSSDLPATAGESLVIYMTGLGRVDGELAPGQAAPASPLLNVVAPVMVQFDATQVPPSFAGLTPGLVGVYQVNVVVPQALPAKIYPVRVSVKGNTSNTLNIPVRARTP